MNLHIFCRRTDIEPNALIVNDAANFAALSDPFAKNGNERDLPARRDPLKNLGIPNRHIGEIIFPDVAVAIVDVDYAAVFESDPRSETRFTQRQSDVVAGAEMLLEQRMQVDVGKNVAAVNHERLRAERRFGVFDPTAGFEEDRFIFKFDWVIAIMRALEGFGKTGGVQMSVDNKPRATGGNQMVEG